MVGSVTTQGNRSIRADIARKRFNLDGRGIKIGVISDTFNALGGTPGDVRSGDLPGRNNPDGFRKPVRVLRDLNQGVDEGRALLQIVFDIAPRAELLFHTVGEDEQSFATAVRALAAAGADIIVDDILLSTSTFFQDGVAAQAVTEVTDQGVVYVTAAGNNGNRSYESQFRPSTTFNFRGETYEAHDFDPTDGVDLFQDIQMPGDSEIDLLLNWDQPSGAVTSDLELFIVDRPQLPEAGGEILESGTVLTEKEEDPSKRVSYFANSDETVYLLIARRTSAATRPDQIKWISFANTADGTTTYQYVNDSPTTPGSSTIYGHQNAASAITVGAVSFRKTPAFGKPPELEAFSSTGSVPILFDRQGNRLSLPVDRRKPEIAGPDRVSTSVFGFSAFPGTSAAAPHVAAVIALMLQRAGGRNSLTRSQLVAALQKNALPIASSLISGLGLLQADEAVLQAFVVEIVGTINSDRLVGTNASENILGLDGNDVISGGSGFDALLGGGGRDQIQGDQGNDYILGQAGNDVLVGGQGQDNLSGGEGRDNLNGGAGNDRLQGNGDNDRLSGGRGNNWLTGGEGKDIFVVQRQGFANITDFRDRIDRIGLVNGLKFAQLDFDQVGQDTVIKLGNRNIARLNGAESDRVSAANFVRITL